MNAGFILLFLPGCFIRDSVFCSLPIRINSCASCTFQRLIFRCDFFPFSFMHLTFDIMLFLCLVCFTVFIFLSDFFFFFCVFFLSVFGFWFFFFLLLYVLYSISLSMWCCSWCCSCATRFLQPLTSDTSLFLPVFHSLFLCALPCVCGQQLCSLLLCVRLSFYNMFSVSLFSVYCFAFVMFSAVLLTIELFMCLMFSAASTFFLFLYACIFHAAFCVLYNLVSVLYVFSSYFPLKPFVLCCEKK